MSRTSNTKNKPGAFSALFESTQKASLRRPINRRANPLPPLDSDHLSDVSLPAHGLQIGRASCRERVSDPV